jgi:major membrane immunogen (membrane-anchored lipoprotein)
MVKTIYIDILIILFSLSACVQEIPISPSPNPVSGIEGFVTEGPMCPGPVTMGDTIPQEQPYQATISILDANNKLITQLQTDVSGYFKTILSPGNYILHPESDKALLRAGDQTIVVTAGKFTRVTIRYDSGILNGCIQEITITPSPIPPSGIEGLVTKGPMCPGPVAIGDTKCQDQPYQTAISVLDINNKPITQFQTDVSGLFKIPLAPGTYVLHPESTKNLPHAADQTVIVVAGKFTQVTIQYDTGIR